MKFFNKAPCWPYRKHKPHSIVRWDSQTVTIHVRYHAVPIVFQAFLESQKKLMGIPRHKEDRLSKILIAQDFV
jgi:hypothetical protein